MLDPLDYCAWFIETLCLIPWITVLDSLNHCAWSVFFSFFQPIIFMLHSYHGLFYKYWTKAHLLESMRTPHLRALITYFNYLYMYVRAHIQHQNICSVQCSSNQTFIFLFIINTYPSIKSIKSQVWCLSIYHVVYLSIISIYPIAILVTRISGQTVFSMSTAAGSWKYVFCARTLRTWYSTCHYCTTIAQLLLLYSIRPRPLLWLAPQIVSH